MQSFVVEESLNSVRVFWLKQDKLIEEIYKIARKVGKEDQNISKIILFGSLAEKRGIPGSDADILIILKKDDRHFKDRIVEWSKKFSMDFAVEIFPYTEKELDNPIVMGAIKKGTILYNSSASI